MFKIIVELENRREYISYFGKWMATLQTKAIGQCKDVKEAVLISCETGEVIIQYKDQKCIYVDGVGEL